MSTPQFDSLLKAVSRSFYLSIRILPSAMQKPVAIAYMLARATDAVTDTTKIDQKTQLRLLENIRQLMIDHSESQLNELQTIATNIDHPGESVLLHELPAIFQEFNQLAVADKYSIQKVVNTLTSGMEMDLNYFTGNTSISALSDDDALDNYTYLVAGCVGKFWTELSIRHVRSVHHWQLEEMTELGIQFGKALQLTNILRDISKDFRLGRCYLPATDLETAGASPQSLANKNNIKDIKPVINKWLQQADQHFVAAETYLLSIPWYCVRLRLAALWPILIGLKTLQLIKKSDNLIDPTVTVKVNRRWVYKILALSIPVVLINPLLRMLINQTRKK